MSTGFKTGRDGSKTMIAPSIFDYRVDCPREIDFDFFDAAPLSPFSRPANHGGTTSCESDPIDLQEGSPSLTVTIPVASDEENNDVVAYIPRAGGSNKVPDEEGDDHEHLASFCKCVDSEDSSPADGQQHELDCLEGSPGPGAQQPELNPLHDGEGVNQPANSCRNDPPGISGDVAGGDRLEVTPAATQRKAPGSGSGPQGEDDTIKSPDPIAKSKNEEVTPLGVTELVIVPKRISNVRLTSATSSMTGVSTVHTSCSSEESSTEDGTGEVGVTILTGALRCLRPPSSTRSYASSSTQSKRTRSNRINMSFTNDETRRIQRENEILLRRIVAQKARVPPAPCPGAQQPGARTAPPSARLCSHAINRGRRSRDIQRENEILLKKIQAVKRNTSQLSIASRSSSAMSARF